MQALTSIFVVNDRSILSRKRRALRRSRTLARDTENQEYIQPSHLSVIASKIKAPFTRNFWEDALESSEDETLVDSKLLSYAYLEAGMIEMLGA
jgi:sodium/potassium-transporting ATPase subunit alpha